jgi:hypothetical protein
LALSVVAFACVTTACGSSGCSAISTGSSGVASTELSATTAGASQGGGDATAVAKAKADLAQYPATPTRIRQTAPLPGPIPKDKKIVFLSQANVPNIVGLATGGVAAAHSIGWQGSQITYGAASPASLQAAFSSALQKDPAVTGRLG